MRMGLVFLNELFLIFLKVIRRDLISLPSDKMNDGIVVHETAGVLIDKAYLRADVASYQFFRTQGETDIQHFFSRYRARCTQLQVA